ncbi:MAG: hypothetical protein ABIT64_02020 [Lysobacteraceae bacterium]
MDYFAIALTIVGVIGFYNAGEYESRDGSPNHGILWATLSLLLSVVVLFVAGFGWLPWLIVQAGLFVGIACVRVWMEDRERK